MKKETQLDASGKRKFGMRDKIAYAAGDFGCNMSFALKGTVQTFWLVYMMLETGLLSILLLLVQIWDAVNDPMIGSLIDADKRSYKMGKFKTYIFVGACGLLAAGALVFIPAPGAAVWLKAVLFVVGYIIWDACYTVANVPYGSMLNLVTSDKVEQAELSTWRSIGSMVGGMIPGIILPMLIWQKVTWEGNLDFLSQIVLPEGANKAEFAINPETNLPYQMGDAVISPLTGKQVEVLLGERVFWAALIMGVLGFIAFLFMIKKITIRVDENSVKTNEGGEKVNIFKSFGKFMRNRPAVGATVAAMGMFLGMQSATTASTIMFATHFGKASLSGLVQVVGFLPMFLFIPFIKKIVARFGKKEASVLGTLVSIFGGIIMMIFPMMPDAVQLPVYMIGLVFFGIGMGVYTCVSWAMMGDAIDYNEWKFGTREEGTVYSLHSFFRKLAQGVGPSVVLLVMGWLGYEASRGTIGQTEATANNMCWLVAGLYLFSAVLQFIGLALIYNIDKKTLAQMNAELKAKHEAVNETTSA
ncbi:MAG: MFS transporter [Clostridia bacterium]|nr:MFS transporter [Clostridia bacterium]